VRSEFQRWQDEIAARLRESNGLDLRRAKYVWPFWPVKWSLGASFQLLLAHERRHIWQARQVRQDPDFSARPLPRLRFQHADLQQHPREVVDTLLADNDAVLEREEEHDWQAKGLVRRRQPHEAAGVGAVDVADPDHPVAVDDERRFHEGHVGKAI